MKKSHTKLKKMSIMIILLLFIFGHLSALTCGDVNSNGKTDIVDALLIAQFYVGSVPANFNEAAADVNGDKTINIIDSLQTAQYYVGSISSLEGCSETSTGSGSGLVPLVDDAVVVIYVIDGLQHVSAATAAANGADNLKMIFDQGVVAKQAFCVSPAPQLKLPNGKKPWGGTSPPNVAIHTGCHVYDSRKMDDIFLAAKDKGIKSVFVGGDKNYGAFTTANYHYSKKMSDKDVVINAVKHLKNDGVRLIRLHLQRIRDSWKGPGERTKGNSKYVTAIINADKQLGVLINELKAQGLWNKTYLMITADHGMGTSSKSNHPPQIRSSWEIFMGFYGPGIKKGDTIPYAESPDIAILTAHLLGLRPLKGHTDSSVNINPKGATGTLLKNIFTGESLSLDHPQVIKKYLESENYSPPGDFVHYRAGMLKLLAK